jgi:hypothetical protein
MRLKSRGSAGRVFGKFSSWRYAMIAAAFRLEGDGPAEHDRPVVLGRI